MNKLRIILLFLIVCTGSTQAQLYFFGRNKVQYEEFNWKLLKTEHFNIYYYDEFQELAEIGAKFAEDAFDDLKVKFNHIVVTRIPLIFYNTHIHFQQTNTIPSFIPEGVGGFFEFMKGRVVIPYLGSVEQFKHVIKHELVHVFTTSKVMHVLSDHRTINERFPPLWFIEGLAEYWSYHWDTQAEMVMRDAVPNGIFASLRDIDMIAGSFLMYKEGQSFLEFVSKEYGEEKILLLMENFWRFTTFKEIMEFTIGESIDDIDTKWVYWLKKKYFPLYENKTPHEIESKKLTNYGFNFTPNYYSDGTNKSIYFIGNRSGYSSVFKMDYNPASKEYIDPDVVIKGEKEAVFESFHLLQTSIDVSKDGFIAFVSKSRERDVLYLYSIDEDEVINSFSYDYLITIRSPKFSTDNKKIVFSATDRKGYSDLFILSIEDGSIKRLTNDYYDEKDPIFGPGDSSVVFASDRTEKPLNGKYNLFKYDLNTNLIDYITFTNANISTPHYSPDFSELYFTSDYDGTFNIWKLNKDESGKPVGMTQSTRFITSLFDFDFVDQSTIVTSAFENFSFQFYNMNLDPAPDSVKQYVPFNLNSVQDKWYADRISLQSKDDRLIYEKEYTLDYAVSQLSTDPVYGPRGGALFTLSDLLGDDRFIFLIYNTAEVQSEILKNFNVAISRVNYENRTNFGYGIFHFSGRRYDLRESDQYYYERNFGGYFSMIYPLSSFQRIEAGVTLANSDREMMEEIFPRKALLLTNTLSFVHDNSLWGPTGPLDGSRFRLLLGYTSDIKFSNQNYFSVIADYRHYLRLGARSSIAFRSGIFINGGKDARRYIAGGSWDLRGWNRWSVRGEKLWLSSVELRFPLVDVLYIKFPFLGLGFTSIRGAAYFDAGGAWDTKYEETLGSLGVGIRINLFNFIALRYDIGKKIENNFGGFQPSLFYQFFFGWDF